MAKRSVDIVRVYEDPGRRRGEQRVLVDRLWPRGLSKSTVDYDEWTKDVAPSTDLRRWYEHDPARFTEFSDRYRRELAEPTAAEAIARLVQMATRRLVLLTATRDVEHSGAAVLRDVIEHKIR
jgi:uncharacterized protein YeaO (DUF488 family)